MLYVITPTCHMRSHYACALVYALHKSLHGIAVGAVLALAVHVVLDVVVELALAVPHAALVLASFPQVL